MNKTLYSSWICGKLRGSTSTKLLLGRNLQNPKAPTFRWNYKCQKIICTSDRERKTIGVDLQYPRKSLRSGAPQQSGECRTNLPISKTIKFKTEQRPRCHQSSLDFSLGQFLRVKSCIIGQTSTQVKKWKDWFWTEHKTIKRGWLFWMGDMVTLSPTSVSPALVLGNLFLGISKIPKVFKREIWDRFLA